MPIDTLRTCCVQMDTLAGCDATACGELIYRLKSVDLPPASRLILSPFRGKPMIETGNPSEMALDVVIIDQAFELSPRIPAPWLVTSESSSAKNQNDELQAVG